MSLQELLDINKIVFGVDCPKIRPYYNYLVSVGPSSASYNSGVVFEKNFTNNFIFVGDGVYKFVFIGRRISGSSYSYVKIEVISNSYICLSDVLLAAKGISQYDMQGLSFICAFPLTYVPQANNVAVKDHDNKEVYKMTLMDMAEQVRGGQRVYLIDYDFSKLLTF